MKKRRTIFTALIALLVLMMGVNFDAEAQYPWDAAKRAVNNAKGKKAAKKAEEEQAQRKAQEKAEKAEKASQAKLAIPQPIAGGTIVTFTRGNKKVALWDPAKLEITMTTTDGGNTNGAVYKLDPATGKVTDSKGASMGSMSADGKIESPRLGTIDVIPVSNGEDGFRVKIKDKLIGDVSLERKVQSRINLFNGWGDYGWKDEGSVDDQTVNPLLVAYVFYGLIVTNGDVNTNLLGYDPDKKYTVEELNDKIEWKNAAAEREVKEYESSHSYAGFDREKHPELKNCNVAAVGLMSDWVETKTTHTSGGDYAGTTWNTTIKYWVIYELTDGRNLVAFNYLKKMVGKSDGTIRGNSEEEAFHEVTDWQRK